MGGLGSGFAQDRLRGDVADLRRLDVRALRRAGVLRAGTFALVDWPENPWTLELLADRVNVAAAGIGASVRLDRRPCRFGGERVWLVCPRCGARRAYLCWAPEGFGCRGCLGLVHPATRADDMERGLARLERAHRRIGGTGSLFDRPPRPKWMRRRTYERLVEAWRDAKIAALGGALAVCRP